MHRDLSASDKVSVWDGTGTIFTSASSSLQLKGAGVELVVGALPGDELVVAASLYNTSMVKDHDDVGVLDRGEPVGYDESGPSVHEPVHTGLYQGLGVGIDGGGRLVKYHNGRICHCGPCYGYELSLAL